MNGRFYVAAWAALVAAAAAADVEDWNVLPVYGGGYVQNVMISPSKPTVWYTFVDVGGPYRSDDSGGWWNPLHGNFPASERAICADQVRSMSVDPRDENSFVLVGGAYFDRPAGVYVSRDGGQTFRKRATGRFYGNGPSRSGGNLLDRDPFDPDRLIAAGDWDGAMISTDNGETWQACGLAETFCCDIRFDRAVRDRVYACATTPGDAGGRIYRTGLYRSDDAGAHWTKLQDEAPHEICQFRGRTELVAYFPASREVRISRDGGATWAAYDEGLVKQTSNGTTVAGNYLAFGTGSDFVLIGDGAGNIFRRGYDAAAWTAVPHDSTLPAKLVNEPRMTWITNGRFEALMTLVVDPVDDNHWLATDFYEIWESKDAGRNWTTRIQGIMQLVSHTIEFDPFSVSNIVYGVADMGLYSSKDGGKSFKYPGVTSKGEWIYACSASYSRKTPGLVMICGGKTDGIVLVSDSAGRWWKKPALRGLPKLDSSNPGVRAYSVAANYVREEFMICLSGPVGEGRGGVYRTFNGGEDWEWAGAGLPEGVDLFRHAEWAGGGVFSQVYFSADGSAVCHSAKTSQSWCLPAGSNAWQEVQGCPGIMCADPFRPGRMLAGAWPIQETLDGGLTWHRLRTNLGNCSFVYLDQKIRNLVIAGTPDRVVNVSYDGGTTFRPLAGSDRVPSGGSSKVVVDRGRIYYLTTGSGVWNYCLPAGEERRHRVYGDALIWFRGGHDANGDGRLQPGEFFDSAHDKAEAFFQTCTLSGGGSVAYSKGPVWSTYNPLATNVQHYLSFRNGAAANADGCTSLTAVNPCVAEETFDDFTVHLRFRWDGTFAPGSNSEIVIFGNGQNWSAQRGYQIKLVKTGENTFRLNYVFGANGDKWNPNGLGSGDGATGVTLTPGEWNDWFLLVHNAPVDNSASVRIVRCTAAGRLSDWVSGWYKAPWISSWKQNAADRCNTLAMCADSQFLVADKTFCGDIAQWAFWPKCLSDAELREALASPCPGDCVFRLGYENDSAKELAASGVPAAIVSAEETWDGVSRLLDADCRSLTVAFAVGAQHAGLDQILRVRAVSGRGRLSAAIRGEGVLAWSEISACGISREQTAHFLVPANLLPEGRHELRLTYESGDAPVVLDVVELRGAWRMGEIVYNTFYNTGIRYFDSTGVNWSDGYDLVWGYWYGIETAYPVDESPLTSKMLTLRFDVPEDLTGGEYLLYVSLNQWASTPTDLRFYLNGELFDTHVAWQYEVFAVPFPAFAFKAGENVLQVRHTGGVSSWWGGLRGLQMQVKNMPVPRVPQAFVLKFV